MENCNTELLITGLGVTSAIGQGKEKFGAALMEGKHAFGVLERPGRLKGTSFPGAEISEISFPSTLPKRVLRTASLSAQVALTTLHEAWEDAQLSDVDPFRIGLIIGGSNLQQREQMQTWEHYADRPHFLRPTYGFSFMDSDLCGLCTEHFGIQGLAYTVGGASASGQVSIIQALQAVQSGQVDVCIAIGGLMDLSWWEFHGLRSLGAMGSTHFAESPEKACRPFDQDRDGFIYGESCGVVVIERADSAKARKANTYGKVGGWSMSMDGNRNPNPSQEGEVRVIQGALKMAGLSPAEIDYINPHGTGSPIGDETELKALKEAQVDHARINATKSIIGHGLTAAGAVEVVATLLQMQASRLHPTRNLDNPMDPSFNWVRHQSVEHDMKNALTMSMGFGGVNTALCLQKVI